MRYHLLADLGEGERYSFHIEAVRLTRTGDFMLKSTPRLLALSLLMLGFAALFPLTQDVSAQFFNGNHQKNKKLPAIYDKGFRPGFGFPSKKKMHHLKAYYLKYSHAIT